MNKTQIRKHPLEFFIFFLEFLHPLEFIQLQALILLTPIIKSSGGNAEFTAEILCFPTSFMLLGSLYNLYANIGVADTITASGF